MFRHQNLQSMSNNESHSDYVRKKVDSSIDIFIFSNGEENSPPRKYHLRSEELSWWDATRSYLARSHYGYINSGIDIFTLNGHKIEDPQDLLDGGVYVAVIPTDAFVDAGYDKYLIKASRSWEKRQQQKQSDDDPVPKPESSNRYGKWTNSAKISASDFTPGSKRLEKLQPVNTTVPRSNLRNTTTRSSIIKSNDLTRSRKNASLTDSLADKFNPKRSFAKQKLIKSTSIIKKKESPIKINSRLYDPTKYKNSLDTVSSPKNTSSFLSKQQTITKTNSSNNNVRKFLYDTANKKQLSNNNKNTTIENNSLSKRDSKSKSKVSIPEIYMNPENDSKSTQIIQVHETERNTLIRLSTEQQIDTRPEAKREDEFKNLLSHVVERVFSPKSNTKENKNTELSQNKDEMNDVIVEKVSQSSNFGIVVTDQYGERNVAVANKNEVINLKLNIEVRNELAIPFPDNVNALESHRAEKVEKGSQVNVNVGLVASTMVEKNQNELESNEKQSEKNSEIIDIDKNKGLCYANTKPVVVYCCCTEPDHINTGNLEPTRSKNSTKKYILLTTTESSVHEEIETKGGTVLIFDGHQYYKNSSYKDGSLLWRCSSYKKLKCKGFITVHDKTVVKITPHQCPNNEAKKPLLDFDIPFFKTFAFISRTIKAMLNGKKFCCTCGLECKAAHTNQPNSSTVLPTRERVTITNIQSKPKIIELQSSEHCGCLSEKDNQYIPRRLHTEKKDPSVFVSKTEIFGSIADVSWDENEGFPAETNLQGTETNILKPVSTRTIDKSVFIPTDDIKIKHTSFHNKKTTICPPCPCPTDFLIVKHVLKCTCSDDNIDKYTVSKYSRSSPENQKPKFLITKTEPIEPSSVTEFLVMRKHNGEKLVDASTQTDWRDILLEATMDKDGHYSFHLPSLDTLRKHKV